MTVTHWLDRVFLIDASGVLDAERVSLAFGKGKEGVMPLPSSRPY